ncbi:methylamine utilization protein MauJ [Cupriavidus oxalaticus]|uniref:methylamine utilization protein MauJ n=1 Tax=Cupriavidus oxalaticus TaxID=96344 RepID=UPI00317CF2E9
MFNRAIPDDKKVRRALALYREGLNAAEASLSRYAVLSFFKVIELEHPTTERAKKWIARTFSLVVAAADSSDIRMESFLKDCGESSPEDHIWIACRLAVAHAKDIDVKN